MTFLDTKIINDLCFITTFPFDVNRGVVPLRVEKDNSLRIGSRYQ